LRSNYAKALEHYKRSLKIDEETGDKKRHSIDLNNIGMIYKYQSNFSKALEYYLKSLKIKEELGDKERMAGVLNNIGTIYPDAVKAMEYYQRSLTIEEEFGDKQGMGIVLNNMGSIYTKQRNYLKALEVYERSLKLSEETGSKDGMADTYNNIGMVYADQGEYSNALEYYERSLKLAEELKNRRTIANELRSIGAIHLARNNFQEAASQCQKSLKLSEEIGVLEFQKDACSCLYNAYKGLGNGNKALEYHEQMLVVTDSLNAVEIVKNLERMEFAKQVLADSIANAEEARLVEEAHKEEVRKKNKTRNALIGGGLFLLLIAGGIYSRLRYTRKAKAEIEKEKDRSENLLLNILPADIAAELKEKGKAEARDFENVSILFTDFKGFTAASEKLSAQDLVSEINTCFEAFDGIMGKYGIEKIKTIGDAYMAAGGLPVPTDDSVKNTVLAALEMQDFIRDRKAKLDAEGKPGFEMRVGVHTGPVVAGIVGVKKFQYDIWGDTVNTASRMESSGEVGKVNISEATYELLKDDSHFSFESRGKVAAKGKGEMEMYFVASKNEL
jgi:class 3 adenylate cyclase/Tfp pilus assembly protein PilF